jgi:aryl-alcohol dehydrogenase-like predicted oxidoreductase
MIEEEIVPLCQHQGLGVIVYNPLAGGMLTGRYRSVRDAQAGTRFGLERAGALYRQRYWNEEVFDVVERLGCFVEERGKSLTHVAVAWVLAQPSITSAILGASKPEQLADSLAGVDLTLDDEELRACDDAWYSLPRERDPAVAHR